jgi:hypothetical protein
MRGWIATLGLLAAALLAVGCGGSDGGEGTTTGDGRQAPPIGDAWSLNTGNTNVLVRLNWVIDPATRYPGLQKSPEARLLAVQLTITDAGHHPFSSDSISSDSRLLSEDGESALLGIAKVPGCPLLTRSFSIRPRERKSGCIAFQLQKDAAPATFELDLPPGNAGSSTAEWDLRG